MKKILNKILEEINKPEPRLDYIRGLIEASVEEEDKFLVSDMSGKTRVTTNEKEINHVEAMDEASIMEAQAKASLETIKKLSEQSVEQN